MIHQLGLLKSVETEILVHENLKHSKNILKMLGTLESKSELFIIFESFISAAPNNEARYSEQGQRLLVTQVMLALAEINSLGFSCGYFDWSNVVKLGELEYRLFDFNYMTAHFKAITNASIRAEKGTLAPEINDLAKAFPKTDVWSLGHILLQAYDERNRSSVNLPKLRADPIKELESFFGKNEHDGSLLRLISLMLNPDHKQRCDYLVGFQLDHFKSTARAHPHLYQNCLPKLASFIGKILSEKNPGDNPVSENDQTNTSTHRSADINSLKRIATPDNLNLQNNIFFQQFETNKSSNHRPLSRDNSARLNAAR